MVKQPKYEKVEVEVHSGLAAETHLLLDGDMKEIRSLFLMSQTAPTFAINNRGSVVNSEILSVPQEIYVDEIYTIKFSNNFILQCTPGTPIMGIDNWILAVNAKKGDKVLGAMYSENTGVKGRVFEIENVKKEYKTLKTPVYFFIAKDGNILLPSYYDDGEKSELTFICISQ